MDTSPFQIPGHHFDSLKKLESGYWWYEGRLIWAKRFIKNWLEQAAFTETVDYADLGCGTGGFALAIEKQLPVDEMLLVDNSPEAFKNIPPHKKANLLKADLESEFQLPFEPNLITCMDVIEHIKDDEKFLNQVFSSMKPGGLLVLSTAAHPVLFSNWDKKLGHYRRYSKRALIEKIEKSGLRVWHASYAWSFLFPAAPYRFLFSKRQERLNYPKVPKWLNSLLIKLSDWESQLSDWLPYPFGTSIFIAALKE